MFSCRIFVLVCSIIIIFTITISIILIFTSVSYKYLLVDAEVGLIKGLEAQDGDYTMFLGIPFAKINKSDPFGPAVPYPAFETVFVANDDSYICPQMGGNNTVVGTLDCLNLNVYVPNFANARNPLPVLVWIYGGGFLQGSKGRDTYGPKYLVRHDIILVTINYRVGPYGFMCLDIPEYPGNQGLRDQLLALKWINKNIAAFGGDANSVTISGGSAGGTSVDYHIRSDDEKLFNKAIMQSGTALFPGLRKIPQRQRIFKQAAILGLTTDDVFEAINFLSTVDPKLVISTVDQVKDEGVWVYNPYVVCVEKQFENVDRFVDADPIFQDIPDARNIKVLVGYNSEEMKSFEYYATPNVFSNELKLDFTFDDKQLLERGDSIKHYYLGYEVADENKTKTIEFLCDITINHPTQRSIDMYLKNGVKELYHYVFSYSGGSNDAKNIKNEGAAHGDELKYIFDASSVQEDPSSIQKPNELEDQIIVDRMTSMWANFVKYGNPTPEITELLPVKWKSITPYSSFYYLDIDKELSLKRNPFYERLTYWDQFYKDNQQYFRDYSKRDHD